MIAAAAGIVLIPRRAAGPADHRGAGLWPGFLLPSASVFPAAALQRPGVCSGPWMNSRWLNITAGVIISLLLVLSGTLGSAPSFPESTRV